MQNFVGELIEHSIRGAFVQIDYQNLTNNTESPLTCSDDASCLLFDCYPSYAPVERIQTIESFADRFIISTIQQSFDNICSSSEENIIQHLSDRLVKNVLTDVLSSLIDDETYSQSLLTDDEKCSRKTKQKNRQVLRLVSQDTNNDPQQQQQQQSRLFHQIRHRSSSAFRSLSNSSSRRESVESVVTNIAQQIYVDTFEELRRIFSTVDK